MFCAHVSVSSFSSNLLYYTIYFLICYSDVASLMHIEKAITSGNVLVLLNVNESVDSIFLPLIYRINTNAKDGVGHGRY